MWRSVRDPPQERDRTAQGTVDPKAQARASTKKIHSTGKYDRTRENATAATYLDSHSRSIRRCDHPKHHEGDVGRLLSPRPCARFVVQHRGVDITKRYTTNHSPSALHIHARSSAPKEDLPGETAYERHKLVQIVCADVTKCCAGHNRDEPENVLLPLDPRVRLATPLENAVFHDAHSREQLQWDGEHDCKRIQ